MFGPVLKIYVDGILKHEMRLSWRRYICDNLSGISATMSVYRVVRIVNAVDAAGNAEPLALDVDKMP